MSEKEDKPTVDALLAEASKGSGAESAIRYLGEVLWSRLWRNVTAIANCDPEKKDLIMAIKASIQEDMYLAQSLKMDIFGAKEAISKMKQLYGMK
jgi:hypothetical protein